jgi:hypothetical protein
MPDYTRQMDTKWGRVLVVIILIAFIGLVLVPLFVPTGNTGILPQPS